MTSRPDILLIVQDTLRRDRLSGYGYQRATSPELDAFATRATLFERAISPAQWTIPAHASLFTGVYPTTHQVIQGSSQLSGAFPTLAEILQGAGYQTAAFCNNPLVGVLDNGLQRGFEHFYNYAGTVPNRPFDTGGSRLGRAFRTRFRHFARPIENHFAQSDILFRLSMSPLVVPFWSHLINFKGHTPSTIDDLIAYWERHHAEGRDQPLFAFVNLMGTHLPYNPPQPYLDRMAPTARQDRQAYRFMRRFNQDAGRWASPPDPALHDWEKQSLTDFYDAEIVYQDEHLGRLLRYLRQSGALANTLVIICADHGEAHGDHDLFGHGFAVYQELVHVPLIIAYPERFPAGKRVQTNVSTRRIFHTILDAAGVLPPLDEADPNADITALTLARAVNGAPDTENGLAFSEAFPPQTFLGVIEHRNARLIERLRLKQVRRGVVQGQHKLTVVGEQVEGLFNIGDDPAETTSLVQAQGAIAADLQAKLDSFVTDAEGRRAGAGWAQEADAAVVDHLRALGYVE